EVIDEVLRVVDALRRVAGNAKGFRALRAAGHDDGRRIQNFAQLVQRQISLDAHLDVAEVTYARVGQDLAKLNSHAFLQFVLVEIDAVFDQPARFDVAVDDDDFMAGFGEFSHTVNPGGTGADCDYKMTARFCWFAHCLAFLNAPVKGSEDGGATIPVQ